MKSTNFYYVGGLVAVVALLFVIGLFTKTLPRDSDGYHYEFANGQIIKIKTFEPPPGTQLMTRMVNGQVENYYGTPTEEGRY